MVYWLVNCCIVFSVFLEVASYTKQIQKTLREKNSESISSSAYLAKFGKCIFAAVGLIVYQNWVGLLLEITSLILCIIVLRVIAKYKPKDWRLFQW